jgi:PKD repeat protein
MNNKIIFSAVLASSCFIYSCSKKPTACFNFSKTEGIKVGDTLSLLNCSENFVTLKWSLPNNATTTAANPRVKVQDVGSYVVKLEVFDDKGNSQEKTASINVLP